MGFNDIILKYKISTKFLLFLIRSFEAICRKLFIFEQDVGRKG